MTDWLPADFPCQPEERAEMARLAEACEAAARALNAWQDSHSEAVHHNDEGYAIYQVHRAAALAANTERTRLVRRALDESLPPWLRELWEHEWVRNLVGVA